MSKRLVVLGLITLSLGMSGCGGKLKVVAPEVGEPEVTAPAPAVGVCGVPVLPSQIFDPVALDFHHTGANYGTWRANETYPSEYLTFGPYLKNVPVGWNRVVFTLNLQSQISDEKIISQVDVYDPGTNAFFGAKTLRRNHFQNGVAKDVTIDFFNPGSCALEFRVSWVKPDEPTVLEHVRTTVTKLASYPFAGSATQPMQEGLIKASPRFSFVGWVKTSTKSGVILGAQNVAANPAAADPVSYIPMLYIESSGKLRGRFWTSDNVTMPMTSTASIADGLLHHVALVGDTASQFLYVDGRLVDSRTTGTIDSSTLVYSQIGLGFTKGWPNTKAAWEYFIGSLNGTRYVSKALTATEILSLYNAELALQTVTP